MRVNLETDLCLFTRSFNQTRKSRRGEGPTAFGLENPSALGLTLQSSERSFLVSAQWMRAGDTAFGSAEVQCGVLEADIKPLQADQLRDPQAVGVADQDHRAVAQSMTVAL